MRYKKIEVKYWTNTEGEDFQGSEKFLSEVNTDYYLKITKFRSDANGGGNHELLIKITEDISLLELAKSYVEDGVKLAIGILINNMFKEIKILFGKNKNLRPGIEELVLDFKDCKVRVYKIFDGGIESSIYEIIDRLCTLYYSEGISFDDTKTIHIPIFNHRDSYNLCNYKVKLNVDENITNFTRENYFEYWGISKNNKNKYVYNLRQKKFKKQIFYTQNSYNKLYEKKYFKIQPIK